jgi:hypothetical protein
MRGHARIIRPVLAGRMNGVAESEADLRVHAQSVAWTRLSGCDRATERVR